MTLTVTEIAEKSSLLLEAVREVCPGVEGVSVGDVTDQQTWVVHFGAQGGDAQKAAAVLANFNFFTPTAQQIKAEAQRRIIALTGTTDIIGCLIKQHNAQMRATELTLIQAQGGTWTEAEAAEAAALQGMADAIKAIRAASNVLEAMDPIPADYADNSRWP